MTAHTVSSPRSSSTPPTPPPTRAIGAGPRFATLWPGLLATLAGVAGAFVAHQLLPQVGVLTWAVLLGAAAANLRLLPPRMRPGLSFATRKLLRVGVSLLGLSLPVAAIVALGPGLIGLVVVTLLTTLVATTWLGMRLGLGRPRSLLIGTGFAICGASAIAAMEENAEADEEDVAVAVAMVTICGTIAMITLPLLQGPLGLSDAQFGAWTGAAVHEVGQVVAAASPAGAAAVSVAVVVKLTRVLMLAPVVASVSALRRRRTRQENVDEVSDARTPPLVPMFVLAFLALVAVRSVGLVPTGVLGTLSQIQNATLGAALFGMGTAVHLVSLVRGSARVALLSTISTLVVAGVSLVGVLLLV